MEKSEGLSGPRWADCPPLIQARLLGLSAEAQTASDGVKRHFIYPKADDALDQWLDHLTYLEWVKPSLAAD